MSHLGDDDLVLLHYGEDAGPDARAHVAACASCAERLRGLGRALALVTPPAGVEPGPDYEARVWERLEPRLGKAASRHESPKLVPLRRPWRRAASFAALAAALVLAFMLGRRFPGAEQPISAAARERVLLVAVSEHLERSQLVLIELANAPEGEALDVKAQRALADELVTSGRLYRQAAARGGEPALAAVLEELERVLLEVAAGPAALAPRDLAELQRRIESRGLLFKVRVIGTQVREREKQLLPRGASVS